MVQLQEELGRSRDIARELRLRITKLESDLEAARSSGGMAAATAGKGTYRRPAAADRCVGGLGARRLKQLKLLVPKL
jgi:hypothetical protein